MSRRKVDNHLHILRQLDGSLIEYMLPFQMFTHYLMASYAYYILGESIWDDNDYDELCKRLLAAFDTFEHRHKHLTDKEALAAGTAYHIAESAYPPQIRHGFVTYVRNMNDGTIETQLKSQKKG